MSRLQRDEIEHYGYLYFKYLKLCEDQSTILRQDPKESAAAHARVTEEFKAEHAGSLSSSAFSIEQIRSYMDNLATRCKIEAQSFDDHMRIWFCALGYLQLLLEHVVRDINIDAVAEVGSRLLREYRLQRPSPTPLYVPVVTKIIPEEPVLREVTSSDIETWCSHPEELIGKRFTSSDEFMRDVFQILDYSIKAVKGAQYDVIHQDRKEEEAVGKDELLEELANCYLVLN